MSHFELSLKDRIRACWYILTNKEFYMEVITSRYDSGEELVVNILTNILDTDTAIRRLKKGLNIMLKLRKERRQR